ncbi:MAG: ScpA family protein [Dongiaceae bacterium]
MAEDETRFEEDHAPALAPSDEDFVLELDGYEGPIDVLLTLARDQKVDLKQISILELADQYLAFVARARQLRLELAADYLVMAAWLAYLKSRLLLPEPAEGEQPSGAELAAALAFQLQRLQTMQDVGRKLMERAQLGRDFFGRGDPERLTVVQIPTYSASLYDLLRAYARQQPAAEGGVFRIAPSDLYSMDDALRRLGDMVGHAIEWSTLANFLPPDVGYGVRRRSAVASTFAAALELVRSGHAQLRQERTFGPLYVRRAIPGRDARGNPTHD